MRHKISIYSAIVLLLGLAACTQDEQPAGGAEGTPMTFTATGLDFNEAQSRATVDDTWEQGTTVAIQIGSEVKSYTVESASGSTATLTSEAPFYWTTTEPKTVEAWYPYSTVKPTAVVVQADQSSTGFAASDFLEAGPQQVSVGATSLKFTHRTARIAVTLRAGTGITSVDGAKVRFTGLNTSNENPATIIPHESTGNVYEALVAPQTIGTTMPFITVELNGMTYSYTPTAAKELKAGTRYNYNLKVNAAGLELEGCTITGWAPQNEVSADAGFGHANGGETYIVGTADELIAWANKVNAGTDNINCILINDIDLTDKGNWTPVGKSYTGIFDGNNHTITGVTVEATTGFGGFFEKLIAGSEVKNLTLKDVNIRRDGDQWVGSVAGQNEGGIIINCHATGQVSGFGSLGGIIGMLYGGSCTACSSAVNVSGGSNSGGIVGYIYSGSIIACQSTGNITGNSTIGGVAGYNTGNIIACYSTGEVTGTNDWGGIVGTNYATVTACYWTGVPAAGIGDGTGEATKVEGATTWQTATTAMNAALEALSSDWKYTQAAGSENNPPTLQKKTAAE